MLTLISQPAATTFSRNPVAYRFRALDDTGMAFGLRGVRAYISGTAGFNVSDTFTIEWTEPDGTTGSQAFTAVATPSDPDEIYSGLGIYSTLLDVQLTNAAIIQAHPAIAPFFKLYALEDTPDVQIWIEVLEKDDDWQVTFDITGVTATYTLTDDITLSDTTPAGYRILLDVFFESEYNSGIFSRVAKSESKPDATGYVNFDLSDTLDALSRDTFAELPIPAFEDNTPYLADIFRRYYVRYREAYTDIEDAAWTQTTPARVLVGGISQAAFTQYNFFDILNEDNSLLTWYPDRRTMSLVQPEWLAWYNYTDADAIIVLEYEKYNAGYPVETKYYVYDTDPITVPAGEVLLIPAGCSQLGISADTNINKYTVRVTDETSDWLIGDPTYFSQLRTYFVDRDQYRNLRHLMYLNGFSCPATIRCTGEYEEDLNINRLVSDKILDINYTAATPQSLQFKEDWKNLFTFRTGIISQYELDALQELLVYNQLWQVYAEGYIPLLLTGNKFKIRNTQNFTNILEITTEPRLSPRNYSNILIPFTDDEDAWLTDLGTYWQTALGLPWETP